MEQAQEALGALVAQTRYPVLLREALAYQARLSLAVGDLPSAQRWSASRAPRTKISWVFIRSRRRWLMPGCCLPKMRRKKR
jgi:hypothetical protein